MRHHRARHRLSVLGPLDLDLTLDCGQAFRWTRDEGGWSGVVGHALVRARREGPAGALALEVLGEDPGEAAWIRYFRLDEDPEVHLAQAPGAEELRAIPGFEPLLGLRLLRQEPWETLATFVCSAAANIRKITGCVERIAARYGSPVPGSSRRAFPDPAALARARERDLRAVGLGFRAPYLLETARRVAREPIPWEALRSAPIEEARARLTELPGVGTKIADCVLLFGLDRLDAYPVDRWIRRATIELSNRPKARDRELDAWALRLGPGRGYLQQLLFHLRRTGGPLPAIPSLGASGGPRARRGGARAARGSARTPAVALFAKAPRAGRVKTRLVPPLTHAEAAAVARVCLEESLRRFPGAGARWTLFLDEEPGRGLAALAAKSGVAIEGQGGGDLGARLARAFRRLLAAAGRAVVVGSDSPTLDPARIGTALERLETRDAVLGPAADGGCYLIGLRRKPGRLFEGIAWGTDRVMDELRGRIEARGWSLATLPEWYDLDEARDLERAAPDLGVCPALESLLGEIRERIEGAARARG